MYDTKMKKGEKSMKREKNKTELRKGKEYLYTLYKKEESCLK